MLVQNLRKAQEAQSASMRPFAILIQRHGTARIMPQVKEIYEHIEDSKGDGAREFLLAYLLRTDFEYAQRALENEDRACRQTEAHCSGQAPNVMAMALEHGPSEQIEDLAIARMQSEDPIIARDGAQALKEWGTKDAETMLWKRLELWHERWSGKKESLDTEEDRDEAALGTALIEAIAQGNGWLTDLAKLKRLEPICISREQHEQIARFEDHWKDGPKLEIDPSSYNDFYPRVAQYEYQTLDPIWRKLEQFPAGTVFTFETSYEANEKDQAAAIKMRVEQFAKEHNLLLRLEPED